MTEPEAAELFAAKDVVDHVLGDAGAAATGARGDVEVATEEVSNEPKLAVGEAKSGLGRQRGEARRGARFFERMRSRARRPHPGDTRRTCLRGSG